MIFEKIAEFFALIGIMGMGYFIGRIIEAITIGSFTKKKNENKKSN